MHIHGLSRRVTLFTFGVSCANTIDGSDTMTTASARIDRVPRRDVLGIMATRKRYWCSVAPLAR